MALSSPVGLDCCTCCLDLANRSGQEAGGSGDGSDGGGTGGGTGALASPSVSNFRQLREQLVFANLNADKLNKIMRQDSLEPVVRDPCYLLNEGICNSNIDQTMLSILLFFHSASGATVVAIDNKIEQAMSLAHIVGSEAAVPTRPWHPGEPKETLSPQPCILAAFPH
ncbi:TSC22 domain family protein 3 isoform X2 [Phascolarctos cinereus]|uniref:TSC22 domain family protein 3 isoform X2 n=1 Tax=Phascolarctos cinereus TaxID=38626 RepID=A0A6P5ILC1_PHACI|nr:TSC22 domain family protein 3 isoform X2 [Phascolarctos cinereus]